jgi:hypothetical protein
VYISSILIALAVAQPTQPTTSDIKVEIRGTLGITDPLNADSEVISHYAKTTGVMIYPKLPIILGSFPLELYFGDRPDLIPLCRELKDKRVDASGDLAIVLDPGRLTFGKQDSLAPITRAKFPRYVLRIRQLKSVDKQDRGADYLEIEIRGKLHANPKQPTYKDLVAAKEKPGAVIIGRQCDFVIWYEKTENGPSVLSQLNGKQVIAKGSIDLIFRQSIMSSTGNVPDTGVSQYFIRVKTIMESP